MSENSYQQMTEDEISLKDIIDFFLEAWKTILAFGVLGLVGSIAFLLVTPNHYEITAQIQMAQINGNNNNNNNNNNTNPLGVNVEEPNLLLTRMKLPSSYSAEEFKACGLENSKSPAEDLTKLAKFSSVKGVSTIVELKIQMESQEQGIACAKSLFKNIRDSQNDIIKPYIEEAKSLLVKYQSRLEDAKMIVVRADKSGSALSAAYLANRDEVKFLTDESIRLNSLITAGDARRAKLVSPIYASDAPVFPKKEASLVLGIIVGLFLGLALAFTRKAVTNYRANQ
jgi:capsular polysaccharide biosynthesis protein